MRSLIPQLPNNDLIPAACSFVTRFGKTISTVMMRFPFFGVGLLLIGKPSPMMVCSYVGESGFPPLVSDG